MSFTIAECGIDAYFATPMPSGGQRISEFPQEFAGVYYYKSSSSVGGSDFYLEVMEIDFPAKWIMRVKKKKTTFTYQIQDYIDRLTVGRDSGDVRLQFRGDTICVYERHPEGETVRYIFSHGEFWEVTSEESEETIDLQNNTYIDDIISTYCIVMMKDKSLYINICGEQDCDTICAVVLCYDFSHEGVAVYRMGADIFIDLLQKSEVFARYVQVDTLVKPIVNSDLEEHLDTTYDYNYLLKVPDVLFEVVLRMDCNNPEEERFLQYQKMKGDPLAKEKGYEPEVWEERDR